MGVKMKSIAIFCLIVLKYAVAVSFSMGNDHINIEPLDEPVEMRAFYSLKELRKYATSPTAYSAGGQLQIFELDGTKVYVVDRSVTTGILSSKVTIYVEEKGVLIPHLFIPACHSCSHGFEVDEDSLVIYRSDIHNSFKLLTIHKSGLKIGNGLSEDLIDPEAKSRNKHE